jgi:hypothetical protein
MTKEEANSLLEEHKFGIRVYSVYEVTRALWITGDLGHTVRKDIEPPRPVVFSEGFQAVRVGKSERLGKEPIRDIRWTNH